MEGGVKHSAQGVLLFLFSLSRSIVPRITAISTPEEYFNIRYINTHALSLLPTRDLPTHTVQSSLHPSVLLSVYTSACSGEDGDKCAEEGFDVCVCGKIKRLLRKRGCYWRQGAVKSKQWAHRRQEKKVTGRNGWNKERKLLYMENGRGIK